MEPFAAIILDTYGVLVRRSPRYLEEPVTESVDEVARDIVDEQRFWQRVARYHALTPAGLDALQDRMAAKYCKNLDVWKDLAAWSRLYRLVVMHQGPAGVLLRWRHDLPLGDIFTFIAAPADLGYHTGDPAAYERIAATLGLSPDRCLVVNDERLPVEAARSAGMGVYRFGAVHGLRAVLAEPHLAFAASAPL